MNKFSDFSEEKATLEGIKIGIDNILNCEIIVNDFSIMKSKFENKKNDNCLTIQIILNEEKRVVFTGSGVLMKQIEKYKSQLPFISTIKKVNNYYTLS